ncbi:hypothetical protein SAY87_013146 [Trapa incisa]|uniref:Homeobox-leucine zipper protein n=1 Tax=Trapa incisa TaxID=236973 RepID=A0AAN7K889_9MYRT|nr:hypothetical protein SAY87_013146 [Trapa incisa]
MDFFPTNFMLQSPRDDDHHHHHHHPSTNSDQMLTSWIPHDHCHGLGPTLLGKRTPSSMAFPGFEACSDRLESHAGMEQEDVSEDDGSSQNYLGEKKKIRLNMEQVKALEKSFESGNKLDAERKMQLAKALGLQQRQIAIWFQNRRARWKTKQLEKDYDILKRQFDSVKANNDALHAENQRLHEEILALKAGGGVRDLSATAYHESINLNKETEGCGSSRSSREDSSDILRLNVSSSTRLAAATGQQDHDHHLHQQHHHHDNPTPASRQLFPSDGFGNMLGSSDHQSGLWPWFEHQHHQHQHQHLG